MSEAVKSWLIGARGLPRQSAEIEATLARRPPCCRMHHRSPEGQRSARLLDHHRSHEGLPAPPGVEPRELRMAKQVAKIDALFGNELLRAMHGQSRPHLA